MRDIDEVTRVIHRRMLREAELEGGPGSGPQGGGGGSDRDEDGNQVWTPERVGAERRGAAAKAKAKQQKKSDKNRKMDKGGTISPKAQRMRDKKALDKQMADKWGAATAHLGR